MLPIDCFRNISLYCKPYIFSVNKILHNLYDDIWFKDKLLLEHPDTNCTKPYKKLYKRYLKSGIISRWNIYDEYKIVCETRIPSIKMSLITDSLYMLLTFDGTLLSYDMNDHTSFLIATNVIDIDHNTYITGKYCYLIADNEQIGTEIYTKIIIEADDNLLSVAYNDYYIAACTKNKIYCVNCAYGDDNERTLSVVYFPHGIIKKITEMNGHFAIMNTTNMVYLLESQHKYLMDITFTNVKKLSGNICISKDSISTYQCDYSKIIDLSLLDDDLIESKIYVFDQIMSYGTYLFHGYLFLSNNILYLYKADKQTYDKIDGIFKKLYTCADIVFTISFNSINYM